MKIFSDICNRSQVHLISFTNIESKTTSNQTYKEGMKNRHSDNDL
jgi:hypothetical protein